MGTLDIEVDAEGRGQIAQFPAQGDGTVVGQSNAVGFGYLLELLEELGGTDPTGLPTMEHPSLGALARGLRSQASSR